MTKTSAIILLFWVACLALAVPFMLAGGETLREPLRTYSVASVESVYDGDTATVVVVETIPMLSGWTLTATSPPTSVRVFGIDAPEISRVLNRTPGYEARDWLQSRMEGCRNLTVVMGSDHSGSIQTDKYGRWLGLFKCGGVDLANELIEKGLAKPYFGGSR